MSRRIKKRTDIPDISVEEVEKWLAVWNSKDEYTIPEEAMNHLFLGEGKLNTDIETVLIKCTLVNYFYSTNIFKIVEMAKHIVKLDIDKRVENNDLSVVSDIARITIRDKEGNNKSKDFYSFATKYCSRHKPDIYPIYDSYVVKVLKYCRDIGEFNEQFTDASLRDYVTFKKVILAFRKCFHLEQFSIKELDMFLWQFGKKYLPNKY